MRGCDIGPAVSHHRDRARRARPLEFASRANFVRYAFAGRRHEAEGREVALRRGGEQIQRVYPTRFGKGDRSLDERAAESMVPPGRVDRYRAKERVSTGRAAFLDPGHADQATMIVRDGEVAQRFPHAIEWQSGAREKRLDVRRVGFGRESNCWQRRHLSCMQVGLDGAMLDPVKASSSVGIYRVNGPWSLVRGYRQP